MEIVLRIDNFEGPLDLLLHLIEKKKLKISEIKISNYRWVFRNFRAGKRGKFRDKNGVFIDCFRIIRN